MDRRVRWATAAGLVVGTLGGAAWWIVDEILGPHGCERPSPLAGVRLGDVVVTSNPIPAGWTIRAEDLATRRVAEPWIPDEVYRTPQEVIGRIAQERILPGEFLREERLMDPEMGHRGHSLIPRGPVAVQLPVSDVRTLTGFVAPGNFVDLVAGCRGDEGPTARTLVGAATVLAVDASPPEVPGWFSTTVVLGAGAPTVTLALPPADAERVASAAERCRFQVTLLRDVEVTHIESNATP